MTFDFRYPTPLPSTKNWGPGWPNCQTSKIVPHPVFQGGVRAEIKELVDLLVADLQRRGYRFAGDDSWGFGCRATKGSKDSTTPSFHSWGLALDFNAQENCFGCSAASSDINVHNHWVVYFMHRYGFFWLGPSIGDWMHFHFCGNPADARAMTDKARNELGKRPPAPTPDPKPKPGDDMSDYADGVADYLDHPDRPLPLPAKWPNEKVRGYKYSRQLVAQAVKEAKKP